PTPVRSARCGVGRPTPLRDSSTPLRSAQNDREKGRSEFTMGLGPTKITIFNRMTGCGLAACRVDPDLFVHLRVLIEAGGADVFGSAGGGVVVVAADGGDVGHDLELAVLELVYELLAF